jgi:hypothetical protein
MSQPPSITLSHALSVVDRHSAEHYRWGNFGDGWHLLDNPALSGIAERVPHRPAR